MKVSILTTCRNAAPFIGAAMASVRAQTYRDVEHLVTDAGSSDDTLAIIASQPERAGLSLRVDSRPDGGIYEGLNRALELAQGDIIGICNADDLMAPDAAARAAALFAAHPAAEMATFGVAYLDAQAKQVIRVARPDRPLTQLGLCFGLPAINGRFFRRGAFERHGLFRTDLAMASDRMWLMEAAQAGIAEAIDGAIVYRYRMHAGSTSMGGTIDTRQRLRREHLAMTRRLLEAGATAETATACLRFRALEGVKLIASGAAARDVRKDLAELDGKWPLTALRATPSWLGWRGRHANAA